MSPSTLRVYAIDRQRVEPLPLSLARTEILAGRAALVLDLANETAEGKTRLESPVWVAQRPRDEAGPWRLQMLDSAHPWTLPSATVADLESLGLVVVPAPPRRRGRPAMQQGEAETWLRTLLESEPMEVAKLRQQSEAEGIAWRTLRRARKALGVQTLRRGRPPNQRTWWRLEPRDSSP